MAVWRKPLRLANRWITIVAACLMMLSGLDSEASDRKAIDFRLDNFDGEMITQRALEGKLVVLTFSYAFCSVRCPIISGRLLAFDRSVDAPEDLVYLHISVDPDMDTPDRRLKYFRLYGIDPTKDRRWMFVSGRVDELSKLWRFYGIDIERVYSEDLPEKYYMVYTPKLVVIGRNSSIEYEADFYFSDETLAQVIDRLK